jgi:hypothetical protein
MSTGSPSGGAIAACRQVPRLLFLLAKKETGGSKELMAWFSFDSREKTLLERGNGTHLPGLGFSGF